MSETWLIFWHILWDNPLYRALLLIILSELLLVMALVGWMVVQSARQASRRRAERRFLAAMEGPLFEAMGSAEPHALRAWMQRASGYDPRLVRALVAELLQHTAGSAHDTLVELYHEFGYARDDHRALSSRKVDARIRAMRRLYLAGTARDRSALLARSGDLYLIHLLALKTLARVGQPKDLVAMLQATSLSNEMMEEPIMATLNRLPDEALSAVFKSWQSFDCPRVRRLLLIAAARRSLPGVEDLVAQSARAEDVQMRRGAFQAAGTLHSRHSLDLLLTGLHDPVWSARADAARALARRRAPASAAGLEAALKDRAFWVRQEAANALAQLGEPGQKRLMMVAEHCDDHYAAQTAAQELQRRERMALAAA